MPITLSSNEKKKALIAHKEELLQNIKYYENRIEDFRGKTFSSPYFENSSDSEDDFPVTIDNGPSVNQLKTDQSKLRTCLQATQELTSLEVVQSEVNVMVEDPVIEGEPPVRQPGTWREVTAECCIDLVHFSIMFYVHQPSHLFAPSSYRGLKVLPAKTAHEAELVKSVLPRASRPSDAIEVLRSYAAAFRSRRTTLARLADKYAHNLFMEPLAEGGYILQCANLLEVSWRLENKWSSVAHFHHRMKFDLEYMDESYVKIISQAHKQLSDPSIETDERTLLLSKIISTCLEAKGPTRELYESMESDPESVKMLEKRHTTLDQETEAPIAKKRKAQTDKNSEIVSDDQIMAPPKSLPKKVKPKGKENMEQNRKSVKRSNVDEGSSDVKKAKTDKDTINNVRQSVNDQNEAENKINKPKNDRKHVESNTDSDKNKAKVSTGQKNTKKNVADGPEKVKNVKKSNNNEDLINKAVDEGKPKRQTEKRNINDAGNADEVQGKTKKSTTEITDSHKVTNKDKVTSSSKHDPKTKAPDAEKVNDRDKNMVNSKNDLKSHEANRTNNNIKSKNVLSKKETPTDNAVQNKPGTSKNIVKKTTKDDRNENTKNLKAAVKIANGNKKISDKKIENTKSLNKPEAEPESANRNKKSEIVSKPIETTKNLNKPEADTESANRNKKYVIVSKVTNDQSAKKDASNKENAKISKRSNTDNAKTTNDKNNQKNGANNKPDAKTAKDKNAGPKISDSHKSKAAVNSKTTDDQINAKNLKEMTTNKKITENEPKHGKGDTVEKVIKHKSVATKSNEHLADTNVAIVKKLDTKIGDKKPKNVQNKMVIKKLSHRNPLAQNKLAKNKKYIPGNTGNVKGSNTAKIYDSSENGSVTKSKIPQKKLEPISESASKKNPLRISPRKIPSTFKSSSDSNLKLKVSQKHVTNIPRLMKKTASK